MSTLKRKSRRLLRTAGGILAGGLLAGAALTIGTVSQAVAGLRKYYLTQNPVMGGQALTACSGGYHMASLWDIRDPSNLKYNTSLGATLADSGSGPPSGLDGWVRTGGVSKSGSTIGGGNCIVWTTNDMGSSGSIVHLETDWATGLVVPISPWVPGTDTCDSALPVWCVQN